jgi:two-component system chemotaxis response regulator CheB
MPASFTGPFAKRLDRQSPLNVVEVARPLPVQAGTAYIARGDADMIVAPRSAGMMAVPVPAQRDYPWHPSTERMVMSALDHYPPAQLVGVLMTGMGNDGANAMLKLRQAGGRTIAEAESTAVVWGMPGELVKNGGAEFVRPVEDIAGVIMELVSANAPR